jgi:hypothetical protein
MTEESPPEHPPESKPPVTPPPPEKPRSRWDVWTGRLGNVAQIGTLIMVVIGYFYTIKPVYDKKALETDRDALKAQIELMTNQVHETQYRLLEFSFPIYAEGAIEMRKRLMAPDPPNVNGNFIQQAGSSFPHYSDLGQALYMNVGRDNERLAGHPYLYPSEVMRRLGDTLANARVDAFPCEFISVQAMYSGFRKDLQAIDNDTDKGRKTDEIVSKYSESLEKLREICTRKENELIQRMVDIIREMKEKSSPSNKQRAADDLNQAEGGG